MKGSGYYTNMANHKLEGILASTVPLAEAIFYKNSAPNTTTERILGTAEPLINNSYITPYMGNFPECFSIPAVSGFVGDYLEYHGQKREVKFYKKSDNIFQKFQQQQSVLILH